MVGLDDSDERVKISSDDTQQGILDSWKTKSMENLVELRNKTPVWNDETQSYVLNFHGRVTKASVTTFIFSPFKLKSYNFIIKYHFRSRIFNLFMKPILII